MKPMCRVRTGAALALVTALLTGACERSAAEPPSPAKGPAASPAASAPTIYGLTVKRLDGSDAPLSAWKGKVLLVVNTASECGYTPQYAGLLVLHEKYQARGFEVLGFPSNDFGGQEPGSAAQIAGFCQKNFGVTFPLFEKVAVTGEARAPLYALLADAKGEPKWNFHKYLVDKHGRPVQAWLSKVEPSSPEIAQAIERELGKP